MFPLAGSHVDGLQVGSSVPNYSSIAASLDEYDELPGIRAVPLDAFEVTDPHGLFYAADDIRRVQKLARAISDSNWIAPLIVVVDEQGPYVLEGAHRLGALHLLKRTHLPALVVLDTE